MERSWRDVNIQDALVLLEQLEDAKHNVIGVAKARGLALLGVMKAASPIDRDVCGALV